MILEVVVGVAFVALLFVVGIGGMCAGIFGDAHPPYDLDYPVRDEIAELMARLASEGRTVETTTHPIMERVRKERAA